METSDNINDKTDYNDSYNININHENEEFIAEKSFNVDNLNHNQNDKNNHKSILNTGININFNQFNKSIKNEIDDSDDILVEINEEKK